MSQYYCGIDLHTRTSQLCVIDEKGERVKEGNLPNDLFRILEFLSPFGEDVQIGIESTIKLNEAGQVLITFWRLTGISCMRRP